MVVRGAAPPRVGQGAPENFSFTRIQDLYRARFSAENHRLDHPLVFSVPDSGSRAFTDVYDNSRWFYASVSKPAPDRTKTGSEPVSDKITIWWYASLSGRQRDREKEYAVVERYLDRLGVFEAEVVLFSDEIIGRESFTRTSDLLTYLKGVVYDGATDLSVLLSKQSDGRILLFSDGINSLGRPLSETLPEIPVYAFTSGPDNNYSLLNRLSRGRLVNLSQMTTDEAVDLLGEKSVELLSVECISGRVADVYPRPGTVITGDLLLTGRLLSDEAVLEVRWGSGNVAIRTEVLRIDHSADKLSDYGLESRGLIARLWAGERISELLGNSGRNKEEITDLGVRYGVVTDFTSLIVLEEIEDYIRYDILPPVELQDDLYRRLIADIAFRAQQTKARAAEQEAGMIEEDYRNYYDPLIQWWKKDFNPKEIIKKSPEKPEIILFDREIIGYVSEDQVVEEEAFLVMDRQLAEAMVVSRSNPDGSQRAAAAAPSARRNRAADAVNTIRLEGWKPEAPYMIRLTGAEAEDLYDVYLAVREDYLDTPSFFADAADEFFRKGDPVMARRVLSNLVELSGENIQLIKTYGHKLIEYGFYEKAVEVFRYGQELRPEHPQSYRDLALAHEWAGEYQEALDCFLAVLKRKWTRFDELKPIVFAELNSLLDRCGDRLDASAVDPRFIFSIPVNVRVAISWDTDNCDIDLHVEEPSGEECLYSHNLTAHGGKMSADFTSGFGPEAYMIKKKLPGTYRIAVNYYGTGSLQPLMPVTVYADVFTDYGTPRQKRERITLRLAAAKDIYRIGEVTVE